MCFTGDSQRLLSTGADGVLACWVWNFTSTGNSPALESLLAFKKQTYNALIVGNPSVVVLFGKTVLYIWK